MKKGKFKKGKFKKGKFIILEGTDYAGKSTCIRSLVNKLEKEGIKFVNTIEPGSLLDGKKHMDLCNEIRMQLLNNKQEPKVEALLFAMSRYFHTLDIIEYLNKGYHVICDRYFISSLAYQSINLGIYNVYDYNKYAIELLKDYEVYNLILTLDYDTYKERASFREQDAMESVSENTIKARLTNMKEIKTALETLGMNNWANNLYLIDATQTKKEVLNNVEKILNKIIG